jgi:CelD/BcsL family acetyltransferase involved in cellulose biosynthesis
MRVTILNQWESVVEWAESWRALQARSQAATVFQAYEWHDAWWRAFGSADQPFIVLVQDKEGVVRGIAPLMLEGRTLKFIGGANYASDYCDFLIDPSTPEALSSILEELAKKQNLWRRFELTNFPSHSPHRSELEDFFKRSGGGVLSRVHLDTPTRILGDAASDREAVNKKSLKRHFNYFKGAGTLEFKRCTDEKEILSYLDTFFKQHIERRALTKDTSQFLDEAQKKFYREMVSALSKTGWLRFDVVLFNGAPLAFHLGFEYAGRFIWYKPTFDVQHLKKSPGEVLLKYLLEQAISDGLKEFDFTVGEESFKYRFANLIRTNHRITVYSSALDYRVNQAGLMMKRLIKKTQKSTA